MFRDWAADAPDEASMLAAIITGPPEPFVPPELVGQKVVAILGCWCGDLDIALAHGARMPLPMSQIHFHPMGGAVGRVLRGATAFSGRNAGYTYNIIATWTDPAEDAQHIEVNRDLAAALAPLSAGGTYVNFAGDTEADRVRSLYGDELYDRLARLKREYGPTNPFSRNQNIRPAR